MNRLLACSTDGMAAERTSHICGKDNMQGIVSIANILQLDWFYPSYPLIKGSAIASIKPIMSRTERTMVNKTNGMRTDHHFRLTSFRIELPWMV